MKILIIDDDVFLQKTLGYELLASGYTVAIAGNGQEAIDKIEDERDFDVIVCDVMMPILSGPTLILMLKKYYPKKMPKIVVISGVKDGQEFLKKIEIKYDDFFRKPIDYSGFRDAMQKFAHEQKS